MAHLKFPPYLREFFVLLPVIEFREGYINRENTEPLLDWVEIREIKTIQFIDLQRYYFMFNQFRIYTRM